MPLNRCGKCKKAVSMIMRVVKYDNTPLEGSGYFDENNELYLDNYVCENCYPTMPDYTAK